VGELRRIVSTSPPVASGPTAGPGSMRSPAHMTTLERTGASRAATMGAGPSGSITAWQSSTGSSKARTALSMPGSEPEIV